MVWTIITNTDKGYEKDESCGSGYISGPVKVDIRRLIQRGRITVYKALSMVRDKYGSVYTAIFGESCVSCFLLLISPK